MCNNYYMAGRKRKTTTITESLRRAIAESEMSFKGIERETGVTRQSLMKFAKREQSLRLDMADKIAVFFGLELRPEKKRKGK